MCNPKWTANCRAKLKTTNLKLHPGETHRPVSVSAYAWDFTFSYKFSHLSSFWRDCRTYLCVKSDFALCACRGPFPSAACSHFLGKLASRAPGNHVYVRYLFNHKFIAQPWSTSHKYQRLLIASLPKDMNCYLLSAPAAFRWTPREMTENGCGHACYSMLK